MCKPSGTSCPSGFPAGLKGLVHLSRIGSRTSTRKQGLELLPREYLELPTGLKKIAENLSHTTCRIKLHSERPRTTLPFILQPVWLWESGSEQKNEVFLASAMCNFRQDNKLQKLEVFRRNDKHLSLQFTKKTPYFSPLETSLT